MSESMKKVLKLLLASLLLPISLAYGDTQDQIVSQLMGRGMAPELAEYVAKITVTASGTRNNDTYLTSRNAAGTANIDVLKVDATDDTIINSDAADVIKLQIGGDANRLFTFNATTDAAHILTFGDAGVTATQTLDIVGSTANADDDSTLCLTGGGACDATRGSFVYLNGADAGGANAGDAQITATDDFYIATGTGGSVRLTITETGAISTASGITLTTGDLIISASGGALSLQEATAATACMGVTAPNGTTPVAVTTTCATSGSRVFYSRSGAVTNNASITTTTAPGGSGFSFASTNAADSGGATVAWFIIKESA